MQGTAVTAAPRLHSSRAAILDVAEAAVRAEVAEKARL
jgi:hypothetical protein